ncbi:MAG: RsmD family RNA methyltransferase [Flavobacteriales bacterium]
MRIVGGLLRGRRFTAPSSIPARPTTDFAKEALFNILAHQIHWPDVNALDLFSGIGSISIEMVSRGARQVTSIDKHPKAVQWLSKTGQELNLSALYPIRSDAIHWLERVNQKFDFVFADPPYDYDDYDKVIELVLKSALQPDGLFVLEHRQSGSFANHSNFVEDRTYGEVRFSFFRLNA